MRPPDPRRPPRPLSLEITVTRRPGSCCAPGLQGGRDQPGSPRSGGARASPPALSAAPVVSHPIRGHRTPFPQHPSKLPATSWSVVSEARSPPSHTAARPAVPAPQPGLSPHPRASHTVSSAACHPFQPLPAPWSPPLLTQRQSQAHSRCIISAGAGSDARRRGGAGRSPATSRALPSPRAQLSFGD